MVKENRQWNPQRRGGQGRGQGRSRFRSRFRGKEPEVGEIPEAAKVWKAVTALGKKVSAGDITDIAEIFNHGQKIMEAEIVNRLLPNLEEDLLLIGQAKGKFGGGQRRIFRQTQKKTSEGNTIKFTTCALVGNRNGYVGIGTGKSKETVPARDKSKRSARLNIIRIRRGCGSWQCGCRGAHSIPFKVTGKCGSSEITLIPAPKGKGLCIEKECAKVLALAGIKDIWSKTKGQTKTKLNLVMALIDALKKLSKTKIRPGDYQCLGVVEGALKSEEEARGEESRMAEGKESAESAGGEEIEKKVEEEELMEVDI